METCKSKYGPNIKKIKVINTMSASRGSSLNISLPKLLLLRQLRPVFHGSTGASWKSHQTTARVFHAGGQERHI